MDLDIERKIVTTIEEASLAIKNILNNAVLTMESKSILRSKCIQIINNTEQKLNELNADKEFIEDTIRGMKSSFIRWYQQILISLEKASKVDKSGVVTNTLKSLKGVEFKKGSNGYVIDIANGQLANERIKITNLRDLMTISDEGSAARYVDYVGKIKNTMIGIQDELASNSLSLYDSKGRQKSIRNMAEIKVRYDLINEDLQRIKSKGSKYVIASAHANASERCSWWQGKIFLIDIDIATRKMGQYPGKQPHQTILGHIDGKPYYSLKEACENGFLSYNCQHRVIPYYKGVYVPSYNIIEVKKRRDISQKQRYLENRIRQEKSKQILAVSPEERRKAQEKSKQLQDIYAQFCDDNEVPRYDWRTRVTEVERGGMPIVQEKKQEKNPYHNFDITEKGKYKILDFKENQEKEYEEYIKPKIKTQNISKEELNLLWQKQGGYIQNSQGYKAINNYMRGLTPDLNPIYIKTINALINSTSRNNLKENYIGYRKVSPSFLSDVLGIDTEGMIIYKGGPKENFKNRTVMNDMINRINGLVGTSQALLTDKAVTSISLVEKLNYFKRRPILFEIQMEKGVKGLITENYPESEFIAKPNSTLEILGAKLYNDSGKNCIKIFAKLIQE